MTPSRTLTLTLSRNTGRGDKKEFRRERHQKSRLAFAARDRSCVAVPVFGDVPLPAAGTRSPGRTCRILPDFSGEIRRRPAALLGFTLRRFVPMDGWFGVSAAPGPRAFFHLGPPRFIFVGGSRRDRCQFPISATSMGAMCGFWASLPSMVRVRRLDLLPDRPMNRSCLGLFLLQGFRARAPKRACTRATSTPPASSASASRFRLPSAHGLSTALPCRYDATDCRRSHPA